MLPVLFEKLSVGVIGLGYVGLPLALAFSKHFSVVGYDKNKDRISDLKAGIDHNNEVEPLVFSSNRRIVFVDAAEGLENCDVLIVTVPTPVDASNIPDLSYLQDACECVGGLISDGTVVVFESTVYPGCTMEFCVPIIEERSSKVLNQDFFVGYSPERINPGDKSRGVEDIIKVTSGSSDEAAIWIDFFYSKVITAGTYRAESIIVAEAAKVIENTQRDINIALMNELSIIFYKLGIRTESVINAAKTKWNFLEFHPGLVGGHCIGVDPYYLAYKAQTIGYNPEVILAGRRVNDAIPAHISDSTVKLMVRAGCDIKNARVLLMGITFKENCPDVRNSKSFDLMQELQSWELSVDVFDPVANNFEVKKILGFELCDHPDYNDYSAIVLSVPHDDIVYEVQGMIDNEKLKGKVIVDVKSALVGNTVDFEL